jgi:aerobic carbon-monoxide dehydrogenase large subunit
MQHSACAKRGWEKLMQPVHKPGHFGARTLRLEDPALLTGRGRFVDDIRLDGTLAAAFLRSPHAHAWIEAIDVAAAKAMPGIRAIFTLDDLRPHLRSIRLPLGQSSREIAGLAAKSLPDEVTPFILVDREVCYVGDPIAVVIAEDRYLAEDAVARIEVDYTPLDAVADCALALKPGTAVVHRASASNLLSEYFVDFGDVDSAFARAANVFALSLKQHRGCAHPIEGRGILAASDPTDGRTLVWTSTQSPHEVRGTLAHLLGCDESDIRLMTPDVGGGFGAKYQIYPEEVVVTLAARLLDRPVKWVEDRREHFLASIQERDQYWDVEVALDADAQLLGIRGRLLHDQGAYTPHGVNVSYNSATSLPGPYRLPNYRMHVHVVETNRVPTMPVRGAGYPQGTFAMERLLDHAARQLGIDRAEIRRRNLITPDEMPYETPMKTRAGTPVKYDSGDFPHCQALALDAIGHDGFAAHRARARSEGRYIGLGFANATKGTGRGPFETGIVRVGRSGRVTVYSGAAPMGQGTETMLAQLAADQFGVAPDEVRVVLGDTNYVSMGHGGFASRQAVNAGSSVHLAAVEVRNRALHVAAQLLDTRVEDLEIRDGRIFQKGGSNLSLALGDIAREASGIPGYSLPKGIEPGLEHTSNFMPSGLTYSNTTHAVEAEVDVLSGRVTILRYVVVSDCGRLINPMIVEGQIVGGVVHGIGNALLEWMGYDENAQPVTTNFGEYLLPTATELPAIELIHHVSPSPLNPLGIKGVGEIGVVAASAAIISAVEDALAPFSVRIDETPILPQRIVELVEAGGTAAGAGEGR